jgi:Flp pilus assembly secretin CpaC
MRHSLAAVFAVALTSAPALAAGVSVPMDEVRTVTFGKPVATVYIGNSMIADVNMIDTRHAFVLGKAFGTTNIIALDSAGHEVSNTYVSVSPTRGATVILMKGTAQMTLSCAGPRCEVSPTPGDTHYKEDVGDVTSHQDLGAKNASASP